MKFEPILAQFSIPQLKRNPSIKKTGHLCRAVLGFLAVRASLQLWQAGSSLTAGAGLLAAVASPVVEDGLEGTEASVAAAPGSRAQTQ